jgi:hypothetical protein
MKVYAEVDGEQRLIGRADVPEGVGAVFIVPLFGPATTITETFTIGTVTHTPTGRALAVERVVLLHAGQRRELLPGWTPRAS